MSLNCRHLTLGAILGVLTLVIAPLAADDKDQAQARRKACTFTNDYYGITMLKPDKKEWAFLTSQEWSRYFQGGGDDVGFFLGRWVNADADRTEEHPHLSVYCVDIGKGYFESMGKKGLAKALQEYWLEKQYKDIKNLKEAKSTKEYKFSAGKSVSHFEFDGVSQKYGGAVHTLCICHKFDKFGFLILLDCAPGDQKKFAQEIKFLWDNLKFKEKGD